MSRAVNLGGLSGVPEIVLENRCLGDIVVYTENLDKTSIAT